RPLGGSPRASDRSRYDPLLAVLGALERIAEFGNGWRDLLLRALDGCLCHGCALLGLGLLRLSGPDCIASRLLRVVFGCLATGGSELGGDPRCPIDLFRGDKDRVFAFA